MWIVIIEGPNETRLTAPKEVRYTFVPTIVISRWTRWRISHQMELV